MSLKLQPVRVANGYDEEGFLAFVDDRLAAVLVRLSEQHGELAGRWFIEAAFGPLGAPNHPTFPDLAEAEKYIASRWRPS
ncbi:hypothetical protein [Bradyrhizobium sp. 62]|uniref:hypothetical protein n=1 Tax=Bradyrhizobium sp. 62 TaxID=1043588 RepID=UPI001FF86CCA|nr:hypothetical protein [Bradyrhizobium sp. 62]